MFTFFYLFKIAHILKFSLFGYIFFVQLYNWNDEALLVDNVNLFDHVGALA